MTTSLFSDLLVIDCASFIAGPAAATILSDFGARVIKIEPPGLGDSYRGLFRLRGADPDDVDYFWALDARNKESLALDLKTPAARRVLETLVRRADVFITNYPFPVRERLALRAEDLTHLNPRLIYASLTPYGEQGPERDRTGYDSTAWWARSGLMDMVRTGRDAEPVLSLPGMGDHPTGVALYAAIVTALYRRQVTGQGSTVSTSLMANGLWSNSCQVQAALCGYEMITRGPRGGRSALNETYRTADDRAFILTLNNPGRDWPLLVRAIGRDEWLYDPRLATPAARMENAALLTDLLDAVFGAETFAYWNDHLMRSGVTFGVVAQIEDHLADEQIEANALLPEIVDGFGLRTVDSPFQVHGAAKVPPRMAPGIGQHTAAILAELGCDADEIAALTAPPD